MTIRTISTIAPIEGTIEVDGEKQFISADTIEVATVDGWECVVRKDDGYKPGDTVIYFETDSFIPVEEPFMFLENMQGCRKVNASNEEGFRIRIHNMGPKGIKQVSNGLVMRPADLAGLIPDIDELPVGTDLTERLGVKVYDRFVSNDVLDIAFGSMPVSVKDTDLERIQNLPTWFEKHRDVDFEETEKIDGESTSFVLVDEKFMACNRTLELKNYPGCKQWKYALDHGIESAMRDLGKDIALQGELAGEGLQDNRLKLKGVHFFLFSIWDIDERRYFTPAERMDAFAWFHERCQVEHVPILDASIQPFARFSTAKEIVEHATGDSVITPGRMREGIVFKSNSLIGHDIICFKARSDAYELKFG